MAELVEGSAWTIDEEARRLHESGLNAEVDAGDCAAAHQAFSAALTRLAGLEQTDDVLLQAARIQRDSGFTFVREALQAGNAERAEHFFQSARETMIASSEVTGDLFRRLIGDGAPQGLRQKELSSEHGATLGTLGRMVVAEQAKTGRLPVTDPTARQTIRREQHYVGREYAHGYLRPGSNAYYRVSNAMHGARAERLNSNLPYVGPWLGRAAVGLSKSGGKRETAASVKNAWAKRREEGLSVPKALVRGLAATEFGHNLLTIARIGWSMRSKRAAKASVLARP